MRGKRASKGGAPSLGLPELHDVKVVGIPKPNEVQREELEQLGFGLLRVGGVIYENGVYLRGVMLPEGWSKIPSHKEGYWNYLDNKKRVRASMTIESVDEEKRAKLEILTRYAVLVINVNDVIFSGVVDFLTQESPFKTVPRALEPGCSREVEEATMVLVQGENASWLDEHYPKWSDPSAYWDD